MSFSRYISNNARVTLITEEYELKFKKVEYFYIQYELVGSIGFKSVTFDIGYNGHRLKIPLNFTETPNEFLVKTFNETKDFGNIEELLIDYTKNSIEIKRRDKWQNTTYRDNMMCLK